MSGFGMTNRPYRSLRSAAEAKLDFVLFLGDVIYDTFTSSQEYTEQLYDEFFHQTGVQRLLNSTSIYALMGLQELGASSLTLLSNPAIAPAIGAKVQQFQQTFGLNSLARHISWGSAIDLFILDVRHSLSAHQ